MLTLLLVATAVLAWPSRRPARLVAPGGGGVSRGTSPGVAGPDPTEADTVARGGRQRKPVTSPGWSSVWSSRPSKVGIGAGISMLAGLFGAALAGVAGFLAAAMGAATALFLIDSSLAGRRGRAELTDLIAGLRLLARELRSGAAPALAAAHAAGTAHGVAVTVLTGLATGAGSRESGHPGDAGAVAEIRVRLTAGWELASRHGLAITPMIDAVVLDAAERLTADSERAGQVAGPRVSGYVMAALPVLGLLLGAGMGADPLKVLAHSGIGAVLLVVGVTLTCAGLLWSARIVRR